MYLQLSDYQKDLYNQYVKEEIIQKIGNKTTIALLVLENGFEVVGTSACVNPEDFEYEIGKHFAIVSALNKLDELVGYYRQQKQYDNEKYKIQMKLDMQNVAKMDSEEVAKRIMEGINKFTKRDSGYKK